MNNTITISTKEYDELIHMKNEHCLYKMMTIMNRLHSDVFNVPNHFIFSGFEQRKIEIDKNEEINAMILSLSSGKISNHMMRSLKYLKERKNIENDILKIRIKEFVQQSLDFSIKYNWTKISLFILKNNLLINWDNVEFHIIKSTVNKCLEFRNYKLLFFISKKINIINVPYAYPDSKSLLNPLFSNNLDCSLLVYAIKEQNLDFFNMILNHSLFDISKIKNWNPISKCYELYKNKKDDTYIKMINILYTKFSKDIKILDPEIYKSIQDLNFILTNMESIIQ